jgi:hypothetical protein
MAEPAAAADAPRSAALTAEPQAVRSQLADVMKCSRCGLINPDFAQRCDCGFDFTTKAVETSYSAAAPQQTITASQNRRAGFLARAWRGEERLWKVWWYLGGPIAIANGVAGKLAPPTKPFLVLLLLAFVAALLVAYIAWCVMAWRCAPNVDHKVWDPIARVLIVLGLLRTVAEFVKMLLPNSQSP